MGSQALLKPPADFSLFPILHHIRPQSPNPNSLWSIKGGAEEMVLHVCMGLCFSQGEVIENYFLYWIESVSTAKRGTDFIRRIGRFYTISSIDGMIVAQNNNYKK